MGSESWQDFMKMARELWGDIDPSPESLHAAAMGPGIVEEFCAFTPGRP